MVHPLEQAWTNYRPGTTWGLLSFLRPAEVEEIILIVIKLESIKEQESFLKHMFSTYHMIYFFPL